jgi:hypothetical protein
MVTTSGDSVCTVACSSGADCVPGWNCHNQGGFSSCDCLGDVPEICDGKDTNCNGVVDDEPASSAYCTTLVGAGSSCSAGSCLGLPCANGTLCGTHKTCVANVCKLQNQERCQANADCASGGCNCVMTGLDGSCLSWKCL